VTTNAEIINNEHNANKEEEVKERKKERIMSWLHLE
jgi:hypothetical protein